MFEHHSQPIANRQMFLRRLFSNAVISIGFILVSLFIGMLGYHFLEHFSWIDAFLNAAMLLGGMGPVSSPQTAPGKLFAGIYALYCGLAVLVAAGVAFAPVVHRFLHKLQAPIK